MQGFFTIEFIQWGKTFSSEGVEKFEFNWFVLAFHGTNYASSIKSANPIQLKRLNSFFTVSSTGCYAEKRHGITITCTQNAN